MRRSFRNSVPGLIASEVSRYVAVVVTENTTISAIMTDFGDQSVTYRVTISNVKQKFLDQSEVHVNSYGAGSEEALWNAWMSSKAPGDPAMVDRLEHLYKTA